MNENFITKFIGDHKALSHFIALGLLGFATAYSANDYVHSFVNQILAAHPKVLAWIGSAAALVLRYSSSLKELAK